MSQRRIPNETDTSKRVIAQCDLFGWNLTLTELATNKGENHKRKLRSIENVEKDFVVVCVRAFCLLLAQLNGNNLSLSIKTKRKQH